MVLDVRSLAGAATVLIGTGAAFCASAQDADLSARWTLGTPVQMVPDGQDPLGVDALNRQADTRYMERALFSGSDGLIAAQQRGVWQRQTDGSIEQIRYRQGDLATPLPEGSIERARFEAAQRDVTYIRAWPLVAGEAGSVQFELTPHAGLGVNAEGGTAEAGATIRVGQLEVADGDDAYEEDQGRWYLFAAGTGTAVGLNWARGMEGWNRQLSHDTGAFIGDAQIGVAWRRGDTQTSFGYVHREVTAEGVHGGSGIDRDATEGFVAVQFSLRPTW
ncbi:lipid A-modifier LpxR family protein [Brevundimonas aveniformis]|uniref:lipid A-modifier LpxR family protein n=1 Tax=Brevundimonas aveniformis TaxID=370977 RepID=UPI00042252B3|nr:lipid A-modifier LpxR family protein [Brevundimonas aveniformis]